ncbi:hypothetical protein C2U70_18315 [Bradyrhizobium guangdongense]|uniref:hypothetical protein n=1 Tax=Bradyrhizobium guangdongense TaxID=1325090 RepID=UPI00112EAD54|nr:hypothetical protein [Bradyrhizobium guangdongense]TPQ33894.1 hypothetical protein C2U70_18315 [Bradyrhizobium guangdongense]
MFQGTIAFGVIAQSYVAVLWCGLADDEAPALGFAFNAGICGTDSRRRGLPPMDRLFLAMMISALLLLIVAADLLVNGVGVFEPQADVGKVVPAPGRFVP